jgi:RNA polymerase sigma factor (sigma-70 family)
MTAAASIPSFEPYRPALTGHCYRMLGSVVDAEDAVQDTMLRAWKRLDQFEERASLKTWLTRIATNVCLDTLAATKHQRVRPVELSDAPGVVRDDLVLVARPCRPRGDAGTPIGPHDLQIAATALVTGSAVATLNEGEFRRVPALVLAPLAPFLSA